MIDNVVKRNWEPFFSNPAIVQKLDEIEGRLRSEEIAYKVYPSPVQRYIALREVSWDQVRVVILGQDPYHGAGQANGLAFSVPPKVSIPPSLRNIFKELYRDLQCPIPFTGDLMPWVRQGVLLLNTVLTVRAGHPASHRAIGWQELTDELIRFLSYSRSGLAFFLWGMPAQRKEPLIDSTKHLVLKSVHPSPLSAYRGFIGCGHFSAANHYFSSRGADPINWCLSTPAQ